MPVTMEVVARVVATAPTGRLLLTQRVGSDYWVAPGGHADPGEPLPAAARREAEEETGAAVEIGPLLCVWELRRGDRRHVTCAFLGRIGEGIPEEETVDRGPRGGMRRHRLLPPGDLSSMKVFPAALGTPGYQAVIGRWAAGIPPRDAYLGVEGDVGLSLPHRLTTRLILVEHNRLLLVSDDREEYWVLPGGLVEPAETLEEALRRETEEETGLQVAPDRLLYVREFVDGALREHGIECYFLGRTIGGTVRMETDPAFHDVSRVRGSVSRARWWERPRLRDVTVYPEALRERVWDDLATPGTDPYVGVARLPRTPAT